jgi:hypothetical protein
VLQNIEIFEGNFHLCKLNLITKIDLNMLENLLLYLSYLTTSYDKLQQFTFRSPQLAQFILGGICDEIYDLTATLIMLYVSINKDV